jgi:hypothetical protein
MALNSSGPISLGDATAGQSIALENGGSGTSTISLNDAAVRSLAGVASGAIAMPTDFWGKSNGTYFFATVYNMKGSDYVSITYDASNNYYLSSGLYSSDTGAWLKIDTAGTLQWNKFTGGTGNSVFFASGYVAADTAVYGFSNGNYFRSVTSSAGGNLRSLNYTSYDLVIQAQVAQPNGRVALATTRRIYTCYGVWSAMGVATTPSGGNASTQYSVNDSYISTLRGTSLCVATDASSNVYVGGDTYDTGLAFYYAAWAKFPADVRTTPSIYKGIQYSGQTMSGRGIAVASSGNVYFGASGNTPLISAIAKYDSSGTRQWIRSYSGAGRCICYGLTIDSSENVYVIFEYRSSGSGNNNTAIVKYNSSGTLQWQRQLSCVVNASSANLSISTPPISNCIAIDNAGAIVCSLGYFNGARGAHLFIAKLPSNGSKTGTYTMTDSQANSVVITYAAGDGTDSAGSGYSNDNVSWSGGTGLAINSAFSATSTSFTAGYNTLVI